VADTVDELERRRGIAPGQVMIAARLGSSAAITRIDEIAARSAGFPAAGGRSRPDGGPRRLSGGVVRSSSPLLSSRSAFADFSWPGCRIDASAFVDRVSGSRSAAP
jgi:hypothetical protein